MHTLIHWLFAEFLPRFESNIFLQSIVELPFVMLAAKEGWFGIELYIPKFLRKEYDNNNDPYAMEVIS